jgi:hypothetical protein
MTDPPPIIVKIVDPEPGVTDQIRDLLVGALGLSGVLLLFAVVAAVFFGAGLFWLRSRDRRT